MNSIKVVITKYIVPPEGATHFVGSLLNNPAWYKMIVVGTCPHWFKYRHNDELWIFESSHTPHFIKPIPFDEEVRVY